jgi:hypothetical protein
LILVVNLHEIASTTCVVARLALLPRAMANILARVMRCRLGQKPIKQSSTFALQVKFLEIASTTCVVARLAFLPRAMSNILEKVSHCDMETFYIFLKGETH